MENNNGQYGYHTQTVDIGPIFGGVDNWPSLPPYPLHAGDISGTRRINQGASIFL